MMTWNLELEVLAWLCLNIQIEIPHNQLNDRQAEIPNPGFFDDSIPMESPHTYVNNWSVLQKLKFVCSIISKSESKVVTWSAIFQ